MINVRENAFCLKSLVALKSLHGTTRWPGGAISSSKVFAPSGSEAIDLALRLVRAVRGRPGIVSAIGGYHGHAGGPTIGMWDQQGGVPHTGDYPLYPNTCYAIELNNAIFLPEWNKKIRIMLEEDAYFDGQSCHYIDGRQTELYLIPRVLTNHGK